MIGMQRWRGGLLAATLWVFGVLGAVAESAPATETETLIEVDGATLSVAYVRSYMIAEARKRFYHLRPGVGELTPFMIEMVQKVVDTHLAAEAARARGFVPENPDIEAQLERVDARNADNPEWDERREGLLEVMRRQLEDIDLAAQYEAAVRGGVPEAGEAELRRYYEAHPEQFTEPVRIRASAILLRVDPSSPQTAWREAMERGQALHARLVEGADFVALAREHSDDATAANGGDLGYIHEGMFGANLQQAIDRLEAGQFTPATRVLEGVVIVHVDERIPSRLVPLEDVRERLAGLWRRDAEEQAWEAAIASLREGARIVVDDQKLAELNQEFLRQIN